jgi:hypothetical protein
MQGNWRGYGRWYPGSIVACTNGLFTIAYDDGSRETNVLGAKIRRCTQPRCNRRSLRVRKNASVTANFGGRGRWFPAVVSAVNTSTCTYTLTYCDGDRETSVPPTRVRASRSTCTCRYRTFRIGAQVNTNYQGRGRYYAGTICGCSSRTQFKICYSDGDKEARVPRSRVRCRSSCRIP